MSAIEAEQPWRIFREPIRRRVSRRDDGLALQGLVSMVHAAVRDDAPSISVHGYRGASLLDNAETIEEEAGMARQRAEKIAGIIAGLGYPKERIRVAWTDAAAKPDGRTDWQKTSRHRFRGEQALKVGEPPSRQ